MSQQEVMLRGVRWRRQILLWVLLTALGVLVLHVLSPGTIASIFSAIFNGFTHLFDYIGDIVDSLRELVHKISNWYR